MTRKTIRLSVETELARALEGFFYVRLEKRVYRAPWSSNEVDHLVYVDWKVKYALMISIDIGVRHRTAHEFSKAMLIANAGWDAETIKIVFGKHACFNRFILGKFLSWPFPWALDPMEIGIDACVKKITGCLQEDLRPLVSGVKDDPTMYNFLTDARIKNELIPLGAARTAEAIFIGKRLNYPRSKVMSDIEPFHKSIGYSINDRAKSTEEYLAQVWAAA